MDKARYSTLGFSVHAKLDENGGLWPTSYALEELTDDGAKTIATLVKKAVLELTAWVWPRRRRGVGRQPLRRWVWPSGLRHRNVVGPRRW